MLPLLNTICFVPGWMQRTNQLSIVIKIAGANTGTIIKIHVMKHVEGGRCGKCVGKMQTCLRGSAHCKERVLKLFVRGTQSTAKPVHKKRNDIVCRAVNIMRRSIYGAFIFHFVYAAVPNRFIIVLQKQIVCVCHLLFMSTISRITPALPSPILLVKAIESTCRLY